MASGVFPAQMHIRSNPRQEIIVNEENTLLRSSRGVNYRVRSTKILKIACRRRNWKDESSARAQAGTKHSRRLLLVLLNLDDQAHLAAYLTKTWPNDPSCHSCHSGF